MKYIKSINGMLHLPEHFDIEHFKSLKSFKKERNIVMKNYRELVRVHQELLIK
jgi:hypothetical protein